MVLGLTATPIAMKHYGFDLSQIAAEIQLYILSRFVTSFCTGKLIDRFGVIKIKLMGLLLMLAYIALAVSDVLCGIFAITLVLMGLDWNFLYTVRTSLLATTYTTGYAGGHYMF